MQAKNKSRYASSLGLQEVIALRNLRARPSISTDQASFILMSGPNLQGQGCIWERWVHPYSRSWKQMLVLGSKEGKGSSLALLLTSSGEGYVHSCTHYIL